MSRISLLSLVVLTALFLSACQPAAQPTAQAAAEPSPTVKATRAAVPTAKPFATPTFSPTLLSYLQPVEKAAGSGPVVLYYEGNAQAEMIDAAGQRVLVDVFDPERLTNPASAADVLLTTHSHQDHLKSAFLTSFPGQQLKMTPGSLILENIVIRGLPAAHNDGDLITENSASDILFIIDIGGLRVAHLGDLGQSQLTPEQLAAIGTVDVAFMQLSNSYSSMSLANKKGFNLLDQLKPRIIIPTHLDKATAEFAVSKWKATYSETAITLDASKLPEETWIIFMGKAAAFKEDFKLEIAGWLNQ